MTAIGTGGWAEVLTDYAAVESTGRRLVAQLCALERRTAWGGRDSIDHGPGGHDDVANAVAGAVGALTLQGGGLVLLMKAEYERLRATGSVL